MNLKQIMTSPVISVEPEESVEVAARTLEHYNIGALPVCRGGRLYGVVTDRDLVIRCLACGKDPAKTSVREVMTTRVISARSDMDTAVAASLMGREKVRRLPVVENGIVRGIVSLGDIANVEQNVYDAADALGEISSQTPQSFT